MKYRRAGWTLRFVRTLCVQCLIICFSLTVLAQRGGMNDPQHLDQISLSYNTAPGTGVLIFNVFAERTTTHLDRQALIKLINSADHTATFQTTEDNAQGVLTNIAFGNYEVEISAIGYLSEHKELVVTNSLGPSKIDIVLHRDPAAIHLDVADSILSPKARKDAKHAISYLKSNNLASAQKQLDQAYGLAPNSSDVNFLLGYLHFEKKEYPQAANYLGAAATLSPHNGQTWTLLGRTNLEIEDYPAARSALEQAVTTDSENWLPHSLLADAYLHQKEYGKARDEAQIALTKGQGTNRDAANSSNLVLGEALVGLGQNQDGIQALNRFLDESPRHPMAGRVRDLIAQIKDQVPESAPVQPDSVAKKDPNAPGVRLFGIDPIKAMSPPTLSVKSWEPPTVDDAAPSVVPNVECPEAQVIEESGKRVQELVDDVQRFAAVEDLFHQALDNFGIPVRTEKRKYNYVASISETEPGFIAVDEYRAEKVTLEGYPDQIASSGFVTLALVFHPHMRDNFEMKCEGLGDWRGQASWLVHFRQREDRPSRMHAYKVGNQLHTVDLKGRAWITADKFQIVRIEADMVRPMPEIRLLSEHQAVDYGPVPFAAKNTTLWLPKSAEIYFDFRKHRYYRRHSFDHFMLYSVDTEEKRKVPKAQPDGGNPS
jgi:tetratricopeptide (TPR) repeat protein